MYVGDRGVDGQWRLTIGEKKRILLNNIYGVDIDPFHDSCVRIIKACVPNALKEAAGMATKVETLAMPVFASGHGRFGFGESLKAMADALTECADSAVKRVCIVVRRPGQGALAQQHLERRFGSIEAERQAL